MIDTAERAIQAMCHKFAAMRAKPDAPARRPADPAYARRERAGADQIHQRAGANFFSDKYDAVAQPVQEVAGAGSRRLIVSSQRCNHP